LPALSRPLAVAAANGLRGSIRPQRTRRAPGVKGQRPAGSQSPGGGCRTMPDPTSAAFSRSRAALIASLFRMRATKAPNRSRDSVRGLVDRFPSPAVKVSHAGFPAAPTNCRSQRAARPRSRQSFAERASASSAAEMASTRGAPGSQGHPPCPPTLPAPPGRVKGGGGRATPRPPRSPSGSPRRAPPARRRAAGPRSSRAPCPEPPEGPQDEVPRHRRGEDQERDLGRQVGAHSRRATRYPTTSPNATTAGANHQSDQTSGSG